MTNAFSYSPSQKPEVSETGACDALVAKMKELSSSEGIAYSDHESSLALPLDTLLIERCEALMHRLVGEDLKYLVVIGIGGSNLGAKAVYDALRGSLDLARIRYPKIIFLDTLSYDVMNDTLAVLSHDVHRSSELLINIVSKSGTTTESIANFALLFQTLAKRFDDIASRIVTTTDQGSALWNAAEERGISTLAIPEPVGGRFSVFSAVGLFPLMVAGVDVRKFCDGGRDMLRKMAEGGVTENDAVVAAGELANAKTSGSTILNLFYFHPELESLGKWERQLFAESLGKEKDLSGKVVHAGITPIVSIASTDLHSMAQLYFGGPRDKFTLLVRARVPASHAIKVDAPLLELVPSLAGKNSGDVMDAIYGGVLAAYVSNGLPHATVDLSEISAYTLGAYMEWRMATVMCLAKLWELNAFDQPNVEDYKKVTREILTR